MFKSFFLAGYECATGFNERREWIDQIRATHHDTNVDADYQALQAIGIHAIREAIRWPLVDRAGQYDFSGVDPFIEAAQKYELEVIWDLFHYGYPFDLDIFSPEMPERFAKYCRACAEYVRDRTDGICYFTPINEPSFFAWAAADVGKFAPWQKGRAFELKVQLAKAAIAAINAIKEVCPEARIVNVDPLCHVVGPADRPEMQPRVDHFNQRAVFESWDMVAGKLFPELGGSPEHLDIVGINYYWTNQWELGKEGTPLDDDDPRRLPLRELVESVWHRYGAELLISETGHVGDNRGPWLLQAADEAAALIDRGVPLNGICLYPILGIPEWHDRDTWTLMGLWDPSEDRSSPERRLCLPMLEALKRVNVARPPRSAAQRPSVVPRSATQNGHEKIPEGCRRVRRCG